MFDRINKMKVKDIKKLHLKLGENELLRIVLRGGAVVDIKSQDNFVINKDYLNIGNLKCFTEEITLYDVLKFIEN